LLGLATLLAKNGQHLPRKRLFIVFYLIENKKFFILRKLILNIVESIACKFKLFKTNISVLIDFKPER
jgi:hypothetical protein